MYRQNAGGGGSFLVNDFMCRDILLLVKELLQEYNVKHVIKQEDLKAVACSISSVKELNSRSVRLEQVVTDTLWRFQLITRDLVRLEYGLITNSLASGDANSASARSHAQETQVYEVMKKRKELEMARKNASGNNNQKLAAGGRRLSQVFSRRISNAFISHNDDTASQVHSSREGRRRAESKRSLSLIYPLNKQRYSNSTIMKLLSRVDTLSVLFLAGGKLDEANQLVKKYAANKQIQGTFEFREIIFSSIYNQILDDLVKLNAKQQLKHRMQTTLIEKSLQSLQLDKLTENMLAFDKGNDLLQCLCLCDVLSISSLDVELSSQIVDYAR